MLPECPTEIVEAQKLGIAIYAGEAEGEMDEILLAAWAGELKPLYNLMKDLPDLANATLPILPEKVIRRMAGAYTSFDAGRGSPFQCSFCTSSTCRDASRAIARLTMSRKLSGSMPRRIFSGSSSPTTTLRATRTGKRFSTGSSGCARSRASNSR